MLSFSIIIPTYNRPQALGYCLRAIAQLDLPRSEFEVIVVDDGGVHHLSEIVAPFQSQMEVIFLRQSNAGAAAARNTGAAQARADFLAFTDDDCAPSPGWLSAFKRQFAHTPDCLLGGRTLNRLSANPYSVASQRITDYVYSFYNVNPNSARFFCSNNFVLSTELFQALGGFNPIFRPSEDRDICDRWLLAGRRMLFIPDAVVYHAHALSFSRFIGLYFRYGRGAWHFHQVSRKRRGGKSVFELPFYLGLLSPKSYARLPDRRVRHISLVALWQFANLAGFVWEGLREASVGRTSLLSRTTLPESTEPNNLT